MAKFTHTYPGAAFDADGRHIGPGPWLDVIRKANGLTYDDGHDLMFGSAVYAADDAKGAREIYKDADVVHDFPSPDKPPMPPDAEFGSRAWERVARKRAAIHDEWLRDPRNTVTIISKTDHGAKYLAAAHAAVSPPPPPDPFGASSEWSTR